MVDEHRWQSKVRISVVPSDPHGSDAWAAVVPKHRCALAEDRFEGDGESPRARHSPESRLVPLAIQLVGSVGANDMVGLDLIEVHNEMVKRVVPPERLLIMNLNEGWQPLCKFLDKPVPTEPFPRLNDAEEAEKVAKGIFARCVLVWLGIIGATVVGTRTAARFLKSQDLGL